MGYKIKPATQAVVCRILEAGGTLDHAADAIGCTTRALHAARNRDPEFDTCVRESQSRSRQESLISLADAAKENGNLAYKRLRMLYPDDYARAADTVQFKSVSRLFGEMLYKVRDAVDDPATIEKIGQCFLQMNQDCRDRKTPKSRSPIGTVEQVFGPDDREAVLKELEALEDHSADEALQDHSVNPNAEAA
jgi:hypothetical protein